MRMKILGILAFLSIGGCTDKDDRTSSAASAPASAASSAPASGTAAASAVTATGAASASTSASAAASAKAPPPDCCKDLKVGQTYVFEIFGGMTDERKINEVTPTEVAFRSKTVAGKDVIRDKDERWNLGERADWNIVKPGVTHKEVGMETLTISGKKFECHVFEGDDGPAHYKEWRSTKFPFTIKLSVDGEKTLALVAIK
jgi:hypothetical protein